MRRSVAFLLAVGVLCGVLLMALLGPDHSTTLQPVAPLERGPAPPAEATP